MTRSILIAGPTAAGKTALALHAAQVLDGEIINADSMQIYDGLHLITARPDASETTQAPHHLFGSVDPSKRWSVGEWSLAALDLIQEIKARGKTPILVGGTGLYFLSLTQGLAPVPEIDAASRKRTENLIETEGLEGLRREADRLDPVSAQRIEPADAQRLQRVVEVGYATGEALSDFHKQTQAPLEVDAWTGVIIDPDRQKLYQRIEDRFDSMMKQGALEEVDAFAKRGLDPLLPAMKALGIPPLMTHLRGEMDLEDAISLSKRDSRRYAKRQLTWFRNQHADWNRIDSLDPKIAQSQLEGILSND